MDSILTGDIWEQVSLLAKSTKRRLVAVAYVTTEANIGFKKNDVLICDASDKAIKTRETSAHLLNKLSRKGVEIRSRSDLHAKMAVLGKHALIGSCNLSNSSAEELTELALITDRNQIVAQATAFIHELRESSEIIDDKFLRRILKLKLCPVKLRGSKRKHTTQFGNKLWIISVNELAEDSFPNEHLSVERGMKKASTLVAEDDSTISWVRWTGKARFRALARKGDRVIQILKSLSGKEIKVYAPCPIVHRQDVDHWTRFYLMEPDDSVSISWERFSKDAIKYGLSKITKNSTRELSRRETILIDNMLK